MRWRLNVSFNFTSLALVEGARQGFPITAAAGSDQNLLLHSDPLLALDCRIRPTPPRLGTSAGRP